MISTFPPGCAFRIIGGASESHRARRTAEFRERHAANVGSKTHQIDQMGVERRNHEPGARHRDDQVDVLGLETRTLQTALGSLAAELHRMLHILIVRFLQVARLDGVLDRENRVPLVDLRIVHDGHHRFQAALGNVEDPAHIKFHVFAGDGVLGQSRSNRRDGTVRRKIQIFRRRIECDPVCGQGGPLSRQAKVGARAAPSRYCTSPNAAQGTSCSQADAARGKCCGWQ